MKKLLIAIDAEKPDLQSMAFGRYLAALTGSELTGVFLENLPAEHSTGVKFAYGGVFVESIASADLPGKAFKQRVCTENIRKFKAFCEEQAIPYKICRDQGAPEEELIAESRYADVLITCPRIFAGSPLENPSSLISNLLVKSECPVIIAPDHAAPIVEILFAHDGSASSIFAIKQFANLFPELKDTEITVLQASKNAAFNAEHKEKLFDYLKEHFSRISFKDLHGKEEDELFYYTLCKSNACLVMGAFGHGWLSSLFQHNTAELIIKTNQLSMFIAHR